MPWSGWRKRGRNQWRCNRQLNRTSIILRETKMPMGVLFWVLMLLWLVFSLYWNRSELRGGNYGVMGGNLLLFILLGLLGWKVFGAALQ
ncbi:MAG: hypothetical protein JWO38_1337 [Gemmataceae bacterium]|nr:hypothetical protein [Gemmataceae bacterium]